MGLCGDRWSVAEVGAKVGLALNQGKTVSMASRAVEGDVYEVEGVSVPRSASIVYLGVEMGPDGSMAGEVSRRTSPAAGAFNRLRRVWSDRGCWCRLKRGYMGRWLGRGFCLSDLAVKGGGVPSANRLRRGEAEENLGYWLEVPFGGE